MHPNYSNSFHCKFFFIAKKLPLMIQCWNSGIVLKLKFESLELFYMIIQEVGKSAREVWVKTLRN